MNFWCKEWNKALKAASKSEETKSSRSKYKVVEPALGVNRSDCLPYQRVTIEFLIL